MRWIPGGKYVLIRHRIYDPLILEPKTGRIGQFIEVEGDLFGWHIN